MLTEKGTQRIEIIVRKTTDGGDTGAKEKDIDTGAQNDTNKPNEQDSKGNGKDASHSKSWWRVQSTHFLGVARQGLRYADQYYIAGISYATGDSALQSQIERKYELATDFASIAFSGAMGATYGATGGPIGAISASAMAMVQTTMSIASKYATRERDYDVNIYKQNNAIEYKRARAQISLTTGRLR